MVCAFKGWNDAGESATSALTFIAGSLGAEAFARIDPEDFVDFQSTRPMVRLEDGVSRTIAPYVRSSAERSRLMPSGRVRISS